MSNLDPPTATPRNPLSYVDAAAILTISGGVAYVVGYSYFGAYYDQLGFGSASILLPTSSYLREAVALLLFPAFFILVASVRPTTRSRLVIGLQNLAFLLLIAILPVSLGLPSYASGQLPLFVACTLVFLVIGVMTIHSTSRDEYIMDSLEIPSQLRSLAGIAIVIFVAMHFAVAVGKYQARSAINNRFSGTPRVVIEANGSALASLQNRELVLVLVQGDKYYVLALPKEGTGRRPYPFVIAAQHIASAGLCAIHPCNLEP